MMECRNLIEMKILKLRYMYSLHNKFYTYKESLPYYAKIRNIETNIRQLIYPIRLSIWFQLNKK
jgi:hypothetical protein